MLHISTEKTFRFDGMPPSVCPFCDHKTLFDGWVGSYCDTCGATFEGGWSGLTLMSIRQRMKLSRKEIAEKANLKPSTIKKYEWCKPSLKYKEWLQDFTRAHYAD